MYLPNYKLNNSYTTYVNYVYLNECIKAGKAFANRKTNCANAPKSSQKTNRPSFVPLPNSTLLRHKRYGIGRVVTTDKDGIMRVAFESKELLFVFPEAVKQKHLILVKN